MSDQVLDKIKQSDFYQEIVRKDQAERLAKRKTAAQALASIDTDTESKVRGLIKTICEAEKAAAEAEKAHQETIARVAQLRAERTGAGARAEREKRAHHAFLLETADDRIDTAIAWFNDKFDELRRGAAIQQRHLGKFDLGTMQRKMTTISNHQARVDALAYCRQSVKKLEAMKLLPEVDQEALKALAQGLPDTEMAFTETQGRKVERDVSHLPPWARIKSDSLHDLEMDHLMKKTNSVLRKRA